MWNLSSIHRKVSHSIVVGEKFCKIVLNKNIFNLPKIKSLNFRRSISQNKLVLEPQRGQAESFPVEKNFEPSSATSSSTDVPINLPPSVDSNTLSDADSISDNENDQWKKQYSEGNYKKNIVNSKLRKKRLQSLVNLT